MKVEIINNIMKGSEVEVVRDVPNSENHKHEEQHKNQQQEGKINGPGDLLSSLTDSDFLLQNKDNNKLVTNKVTNEYIIYYNSVKLVTTIVSNLLTYNKNKWKIIIGNIKSELLTLEKILSDDLYCDIILFLLKNELLYYRLIRKLRIDKKEMQITRALDFLLTNKVIKEVSIKDKEYINQIFAFYEYFRKNMSHAGTYQRKKIKFYALTEEWIELLSLFEDILIEKSRVLEKIDNFRGMLLRTHEELQRKYNKRMEIIERFANIIIELRKNTKLDFSRNKVYIIQHWAEEVFPSYSLQIDYDDLELIFKTYYNSKERDMILKKQIMEHLKEVFGL